MLSRVWEGGDAQSSVIRDGSGDAITLEWSEAQGKARAPPKGQTAADDLYSNVFFKFEYRAVERSFEYSIFLGQP